MRRLRRLLHAFLERHPDAQIETRCGVAHHVCRCGWAQPVDRQAPVMGVQPHDFEKAVRARRLSTARDDDRQRLEVRRADAVAAAVAATTPARLHRFDDRRSAR